MNKALRDWVICQPEHKEMAAELKLVLKNKPVSLKKPKKTGLKNGRRI